MDEVNGHALAPINQNMASSPGIIGNAVWFNRNGGYLSGTEVTMAFSPNANGFAVSFWANFTNTVDPWQTAYMASVWHDTDWPTGSSWHICAVPANGMVSAEMIGQTRGFNGLGGAGNLVGWSHICLVFDQVAGVWSLYNNGVVVATVGCDFTPVVGQLGVGLHTNPITPAPDCMIDEMAIWSRTLSATEVAQLYNNGNGLPYVLF